MPFDLSRLSMDELARLWRVTPRQIGHDIKAGLPYKVVGKGRRFVWDEAEKWRKERERAAAEKRAAPTDYTEAKARQMEADAKLKEFELAALEGKTVTVEEAEKEVDAVLTLFRARLDSLPSKWGPHIVGLKTPAVGQAAMEKIKDELLAELRHELSDED